MRRWYIVFFVSLLVIFFGWIYAASRHPYVAAHVSLESEVRATVRSPAPVASSSEPTVRVPILIYHSVRPDFGGQTKSQTEYSVTPEELDAELAYIHSHGYTVISLDELQKDILTGTTSPVAKPVVLTFDDGWKNEFEYALPILKKYNDTATFFIFTNPIGRDKRFMTWDDVHVLESAGMTIGAHSLSHPYFPKLTPEEMRREVADSKKTLETHLGHPVLHFATPFGFTSPQLVTILQESGFTTGRTTYWGATHSASDVMKLSGYLVERDMKKYAWVLEKAK